MFELKRTNPVIPGYTGFLPKSFEGGGLDERPKPHNEIPGYGGYIPAIKPESIFGKTYGNATFISSAKSYESGNEISHQNRYTSLLQESYINQNKVQVRKVADVVGIVPKKTIYTDAGPVKVDIDLWNQTEGFGKTQPAPKKEQNFGDSTKQFYGVEEEKEIHSLGKPLPGYTGFIKRVAADNIFGSTYAEGMRKGHQSYDNISEQKTNNLSTQARRVPPIKS
jgi:hypothetical protein